MTAAIEIRQLSKKYGKKLVIDGLTMDVANAEITCLLAPSGAGKTTLFRLIAGLEEPTTGEILIDGRLVEGPVSNLGFMFQADSTFPWLNVRRNIEFGLKVGQRKREIRAATTDLAFDIAKETRIDTLLSNYPTELSGGQKQRVVIARSLILQPRMILCDEPFSALDEPVRRELRRLLLDLYITHRPTIVFITHNLEEAIFLGTTIVVASDAPLRVLATLEVDFDYPRNDDIIHHKKFQLLETEIRHLQESNRTFGR